MTVKNVSSGNQTHNLCIEVEVLRMCVCMCVCVLKYLTPSFFHATD